MKWRWMRDSAAISLAAMARVMAGRSRSGRADCISEAGRINSMPSASSAKAPAPEMKVTR